MGDKKIAIYSRKSKFTGKGESIENQIDLCKAYIKNKIPDIKESDMVIYEDEGYSGKNTNRPQFQNMMKDSKDGKLLGIVCYRLDRISRNVGDFSLLIDELNEYGMTFDSINEKFDTSTPMGKAMMYICSIFAQLERETIAERIKDNMRELAKTGRWLGGITPTGYKSEQIIDRVNVDGKNITAYKLTLIPEEAKLIKLIYEKFIEYNSLTKCETYLLQNNIKSKNNKILTRFTIKSILQNPVYMIADKDAWEYFKSLGVEIFSEKSKFDGKNGLMVYNKTIHRAGKSTLTRDISEWIIAVGKHQGIIKGSMWVQAQNNLKQNSSKAYRKPKNNTALLSGLLICGNCGSFMRPKNYNTYTKSGEKRFGYLCELREKSKQHNCQMKNINGNLLDKELCEEIKKITEDNSEFIKQLETTKRNLKDTAGELSSQIKNLESAISDKQQKVKRLISALSEASDVTINYVNSHIKELDDEIKKDMIKLEDMKKASNKDVVSDKEFNLLIDVFRSFSSSFDTMTPEQKRAALRTIIKRIVWDGENIHIYFSGSDDEKLASSEDFRAATSGLQTKF